MGTDTDDGTPTQCVVIDKAGNTQPPNSGTIPFNENSTRALSKKNRIYKLREFLLKNYKMAKNTTILDVAGGRGDLSWILRNVDGVNSIIADPRTPNHRSLLKSVNFLLAHPEEARIRSVEGLPTHQPLAKLLPLLKSIETSTERSSGDESIGLASPNFMRIHVDNVLVETLQKIMWEPALIEEDAFRIWGGYWRDEQERISSNKMYYGGTAPKTRTAATGETQIVDSQLALEVFRSLDLVVGFHPDQATEATIDLALLLGIPFAVVPCCVFPSEFPDRSFNGKRVWRHSEFIDYLCMKHEKIRKGKLPFLETGTAKNVVLYMLKEDFTD